MKERFKLENNLKRKEDELRRNIEYVEQLALEDADLLNTDEKSKDFLEYKKSIQDPKRSKFIKEEYKTAKAYVTFLEREYKKDLRYRKENRYPTNWQSNDTKINYLFTHYPLSQDLLNYNFNLNRYARGKELQAIITLNNRITGGEKFISPSNQKTDFASFLTDQAYYDRVTKKLQYSRVYIEKYSKAISEVHIMRNLGRDTCRGEPTLYADGYYTVGTDNKIQKHPFLKQEGGKEALYSLLEKVKNFR